MTSKVSSTQRVQTLLEITLSLRVFEINDIFNLYSLHILWGLKIHQKCSIWNHFQDKCVIAFYAEIQDGHQKLAGKGFLQNVTSTLCRYPLGPNFY